MIANLMEKKRIKSMDFIRTISVIMIIIFHFYVEAKAKGFTSSFDFILSQLGDFGVSFFIIISGGGLYLSTMKGIKLLSFYRKRAGTIYPSFYLAYLAVSIFLYLTANRVVFLNDPLLMLITILGFDGYLASNIQNYYLVGEWFLGFIIIIYLIYPLILKLFTYNKWLTLFTAVLISIICFKYNDTINANFPIWNKIDTWNPLVRLPEFIFGMIFFGFMINDKRYTIFTLLISSLIIAAYSIFGLNMIDYYKTPLFIAVAVVITYLYEYAISFKIIDRLCLSLSALSFMAFLLHHQIIYALSKNGIMQNMDEYNLFYGFAMVLIITFVSAYLLENVVQKIKKNF
ncbi:acyltransferase family protein [Enterobacter soli]|uniref:acyltransferase family protein n=1 Tax=Enterobacter soli TaxID=885040 RepID=UPI0034D00A05